MGDDANDSHYDELDRLAARSLAAREGGSAEMVQRRASPIWPWVIAGLLLAFVLGLLGNPLFERGLRDRLPAALQGDGPEAADARLAGLADRLAKLEAGSGEGLAVPAPAVVTGSATPEDAAGLALRLQALEARALAAETNDANILMRLDALAVDVSRTGSALVQTDARTRDLFLLAVARRMFVAGRPLGPIEPALDARFRTADAAAVEALAAWSAAPQTARTLEARLSALDVPPEPDSAGTWWDRLKARLSGMVTVRRTQAEAAADTRALMAQARAAMAAGDVGLAVAALGDADWSAAVRQWVIDARLLLAADEALGRLESGALEAGIAALQVPVAPVQPLPSNGEAGPAPAIG